jgi:hypothetical protein
MTRVERIGEATLYLGDCRERTNLRQNTGAVRYSRDEEKAARPLGKDPSKVSRFLPFLRVELEAIFRLRERALSELLERQVCPGSQLRRKKEYRHPSEMEGSSPRIFKRLGKALSTPRRPLGGEGQGGVCQMRVRYA